MPSLPSTHKKKNQRNLNTYHFIASVQSNLSQIHHWDVLQNYFFTSTFFICFPLWLFNTFRPNPRAVVQFECRGCSEQPWGSHLAMAHGTKSGTTNSGHEPHSRSPGETWLALWSCRTKYRARGLEINSVKNVKAACCGFLLLNFSIIIKFMTLEKFWLVLLWV